MNLVVGATGALGGMVARQLLERGRPVRILVRPGSDYRDLAERGAEPAEGDLKDRASLDRACAGVATVVTTANSAQRGGEDTPQTVDLEGNRNLVEAAKNAGVQHFVFVSALGAGEGSPSEFMRAKGATERALRESGLPFTILAPNLFAEVWLPAVVGSQVRAGEPVTLVGEGRRRHTFVSLSDVAAFAVASVDNPDARNQHVVIGGPEALSWRDVVAMHERVLGREVPVRTVAPGEPVPGLPPTMAQLLAILETYDSPIPMEDTARAYGVQLTPLEEVVRRTTGTAVPAGGAR